MPRPQSRTNKSNASAASSNPISSWFARREERKKEQAAEAAKAITGETSANELKIEDVLEEIDFIHSKLPKETLEHRSKEGQKCGDLEMTARLLVRILRNNPVTVHADIRGIDEKIYTLAERYKTAVEQGNVNEAFAAKNGLSRGINEIRRKIPTSQPELINQYVELSTAHLDQWITLVDFARQSDYAKQSLKDHENEYQKRKEEYHDETAKMLDDIKADAAMEEAVASLKETTSLADRANWSDTKEECYMRMLNQRFNYCSVKSRKMLVEANKQQYLSNMQKVDTMSAKLLALPIAVDPDQMNKYKAAVDDMYMEIARKDQELKESLDFLNDMEARMEQMNTAPGQKAAMEAVVEQTQRSLKDMQEIQEKEINKGRATQQSDLNKLGLRTDEQLQELKAQQEKAQQELMEQAAQEAEDNNVDTDADEEHELNYNN